MPLVSMSNKSVDGLTLRRQLVLEKHLAPGCRSLEIGAFTRPTLDSKKYRTSFLDFYSTEELLEQCTRYGFDPESVRPVDYVVRGNDYRSEVKDKFDVVIANHVLEHIPNLIEWLIMIEDLTEKNGLLFLSLPDKRFSFDKFRDETSLAHILADYLIDGRDLTTEHVIETHIYYDMKFQNRENSIERSLSLDQIKNTMFHHHPGVHCHVFNGNSFRAKILEPLIHMKLIPWNVVEFVPETTAGEFIAILRKGAPEAHYTTDIFLSALL